MILDPRLKIGSTLLGNRLREARQRSKLNLSQAAGLAGIKGAYLSDVERGHTLPRLAVLLGLADAYAVLVSDLLKGLYPFGSGQPPKNAPQPPPDARFGPQA